MAPSPRESAKTKPSSGRAKQGLRTSSRSAFSGITSPMARSASLAASMTEGFGPSSLSRTLGLSSHKPLRLPPQPNRANPAPSNNSVESWTNARIFDRPAYVPAKLA